MADGVEVDGLSRPSLGGNQKKGMKFTLWNQNFVFEAFIKFLQEGGDAQISPVIMLIIPFTSTPVILNGLKGLKATPVTLLVNCSDFISKTEKNIKAEKDSALKVKGEQKPSAAE